MSGVFWKAWRDSRYTGARRAFGGTRGLLGDVGGVLELFGDVRGNQGLYGMSGVYWGWKGLYVLMGQKGYRGYLALLGGVGSVRGPFGVSRGMKECRGCIWGGKWTGSLTTLGPSPWY